MGNRLFKLAPYQSRTGQHQIQPKIVLTEKETETPEVMAAWAFALRNTAKGLDLPDYDKAIELMLERHPSWKVVDGDVVAVPVDLTKADDDRPEK